MNRFFPFLLLGFLLNLSLYAQQAFVGKIVYEVEVNAYFDQLIPGYEKIPTYYVLHVAEDQTVCWEAKGADSVTTVMRIIAHKDWNTVLVISDAIQIIYHLTEEQQAELRSDLQDIRKVNLGNKRAFLSHKSKKQKVVVRNGAEAQTRYFYLTNELEISFPQSMSFMCYFQFLYLDHKGVPLKSIIGDEDNGIILTAIEIVHETPESAIFDLPADYEMQPVKVNVLGNFLK